MNHKNNLRNKYLDMRLAISDIEYERKSSIISANLFNYITEKFYNKIIALYYPIKKEVDISTIFQKFIDHGLTIVLPSVNDNSKIMKFRPFSDLSKLVIGKYDILESSTNIDIIPDIIIVPIIVCDKIGNRIGYGKGYYDHTITELKRQYLVKILGVCFDFQIIENVQSEYHDQKIDVILTEKNIFNI